MPFQFSNEGAPYHQPVAPEVPVAPREPQGERLGGTLINAWVHAALGREQAKLEQQQMIQHADLAAQELQHKDKWQQMDYEMAKGHLTIEQELLPLRKNSLIALTNLRNAGVIGHTQAATQRAELLTQFTKDAAPLENAKGWVDTPFAQAAKARELAHQYAGTTDTGVKAAVAAYQGRVKESKIALTLDGKPDYYNPGQIGDNLAANGTASPFFVPLEDAGYIKVERSKTKDGTEQIVGVTSTPKGKGLTESIPAFRKAQETPSKLQPGQGKTLKDMSDPNISTGSTAPVVDLGVQSPPGGPLPKPDMSSVEREAAWVKQQADPKYKAKFLERHPDAAYLIQ